MYAIIVYCNYKLRALDNHNNFHGVGASHRHAHIVQTWLVAVVLMSVALYVGTRTHELIYQVYPAVEITDNYSQFN